jgi:excinuclease ABC subunit B
MTGSLKAAIEETERRRAKQVAWNEAHGITPQSIKTRINDIMCSAAERDYVTVEIGPDAPGSLSGLDLQAYISELEKKMRAAAGNLEFEEAARLRDEIKRLEDRELGLATERPSRPAARAGGAAWKPSSGSREDKRRAAKARSGARRRAGP